MNLSMFFILCKMSIMVSGEMASQKNKKMSELSTCQLFSVVHLHVCFHDSNIVKVLVILVATQCNTM